MTSLWGIDSLLAFLRSTTHQIEKPISFPCHTREKDGEKGKRAIMGDMTLWWASSEKIKRVKLNGIDSLLAFSTPKQKKNYIFSNTLCSSMFNATQATQYNLRISVVERKLTPQLFLGVLFYTSLFSHIRVYPRP